MSTSEVRNAASLTHALAHHARGLDPLVKSLALELVTRLQPLGWQLRQSGVGPQSFGLYHPEKGLQYHLRGRRSRLRGKMDMIVVTDRYQNGKTVAKLATRVECLRFVERLERESR